MEQNCIWNNIQFFWLRDEKSEKERKREIPSSMSEEVTKRKIYPAKRQKRWEDAVLKKAVGTEEFYENEKKERIFPIPSSTSRTLIRRSGFTLTLSNPPASCRVALSFSFSHISLIPVSLLFHILAPICRAVAVYPDVFEEELARRGHFRCLRHNRKCRCNAITCRRKIGIQIQWRRTGW